MQIHRKATYPDDVHGCWPSSRMEGELRGTLIFAVVLLSIAARGAQAQGSAPPPIAPRCPQQQPITPGVDNDVLMGATTGGFGYFATGNCNYDQLASVAAQIAAGTTGSFGLNPLLIADAAGYPISAWNSYQITGGAGWLTAAIVGDYLRVTVDAGAISQSPGYYDAQITISGVDQSQPVVASSWSLRVVVYGAAPTNLSVQLLDPVPGFLDGSGVSTDTGRLAGDSQVVQGVAADGVAQLLLGIKADNAGDQISITLLNDQQAQSASTVEDGGLGVLGGSTFSSSQTTVTAVGTGNGPEAFALYRGPIDFARLINGQAGSYKTGSCTNSTTTDDQLACRSVMLKVQDLASGALTFAQIIILRPPVILVHGLWGSSSDWDHFSPLFSKLGGADPRFHIGFVDYSGPPKDVTIVGSDPDYSGLPASGGLAILTSAGSSSLGFQYNAAGVLAELVKQVMAFKNGKNPVGLRVAAVQADIVAHSMGGDIARTLPLQNFNLQNPFLDESSFLQGTIHKLVTVDTPHLGSTLATQLLQGPNSCVATLLASRGFAVFRAVQVAIGGSATLSLPGAIGDLVDSPLSQALQNIASPGQHVLPTALIAGKANFSNLATLGGGPKWALIRAACASSPLFSDLTPSGWPAVFANQDNDGIVSLNSQLNGLGSSSGAVFDGYVHSSGTEELGFTGPSVLDSGLVPNYVISLLNTPVTASVFHKLNP